ncbi:NUDIX hydrolase, partial [Pseudomonas aeruginosa]|nr:NUDIX hydrolase [Pseudomonas aeruginosa]MBF3255470.1 NUDIX hydrolase [Pseudomonas aeruginosa]
MSSAEVLASVDIVALRLNPGHGLELLLIRRAQAPFAGQWALPGVLVNGRSADHSLD